MIDQTHHTDQTTPARRPLRTLHGLPPEPLSQAARSSRAAMRAELDAAVRARGTRRVVARSAAALVLIATVAALGVVTAQRGTQTGSRGARPIAAGPTPSPALDPARTSAPADPAPAPSLAMDSLAENAPPVRTTLVGYIADDPSVLERFGATETPSRAITLDDRSLLVELRSFGLDAGLIRTEGTARLAFHHRPSDAPDPMQ
ncbi:MAG: hypothetical protein ACF8R9_02255 [Phycisphaerales bacterium JB054]